MADRGYKGPSYNEIIQAGRTLEQESSRLSTFTTQEEVITYMDSITEFRGKYGRAIAGLSRRNIDNLPTAIPSTSVDDLVAMRTRLYDTTNKGSLYVQAVQRYKDISNQLTDAQLRANLEDTIRASYAEAGIPFTDDIMNQLNEDINFEYIRSSVSPGEEPMVTVIPDYTEHPIIDSGTHSFTRMDDRSGFLSNGKRREALMNGVLKHLGFTQYDSKDFGRITHVALPSVLKRDPYKVERLFLPQSPSFRCAVVIGNSIVCSICHRALINFPVGSTVLEHRITYKEIVAKGLTGGNTYDNLFPAHDTCNSTRSDRTFLSWARSSNPRDLAMNSEAFSLTSGIDESDLGAVGAAANTLLEYAYYMRYRTMSATEATAKSIPYLARNDQEGNHIRQGRGHWTPLAGEELFVYDGSNIEQEMRQEVERVGKLQASAHRETIIGQETMAYDAVLKSMTGPLEDNIKQIIDAVKSIDHTEITYIDKTNGKKITKTIKVVHT